MTTREAVEFRSRWGRALTVAVAVLSAAALVVALVDAPLAGLRFGPVLLLPTVFVWAVFERPAVVVSDGGVEVRNVLRTIHLPWTSVQRIDTKYALTLCTAYGDFAAWAAPAPSRMTTLAAGPADLAHLPESSYIGGGVRPGDLLTSSSGQAAAYIRRRWEELRDAGHLDDPRLEAARPRVDWHLKEMLVVAALIVAATVSLLSG